LSEPQYKNVNRWDWVGLSEKSTLKKYELSGSKIPPERVNSDAAGCHALDIETCFLNH